MFHVCCFHRASKKTAWRLVEMRSNEVEERLLRV